MGQFCSHVLREDVIGGWQDVSHERAVLDVFVVTDDVYRIVTWFSRPVSNVT